MPRIEGQDGSVAKVTKKGRLVTYASAHCEDFLEGLEGDAYVMDIDAVAVNGAEHLAVIKNTDDRDLVVTSVTMWMATYKDTTYLEVKLNETLTYAAGGTAVVPANIKSGVAGGADGLFYRIASAGTDITTFAGTAVFGGRCIFTTTPYKWVKNSSWIVPKNQVFSLYNNGNDNTYNGYISFYYRNGV